MMCLSGFLFPGLHQQASDHFYVKFAQFSYQREELEDFDPLNYLGCILLNFQDFYELDKVILL